MNKQVVTLDEFWKMSEDERLENIQYLSKEDLFKVRSGMPLSGEVVGISELSEEEKEKAREALGRMINYFNPKR
ncbi:MAG TPA: hypothetical protein IAC14_04400 [Candidatus Scybalomonas excrementigallinarum]|nr:hypothetical protein [Candidatus Scybalomonas excrementigallinarum]